MKRKKTCKFGRSYPTCYYSFGAAIDDATAEAAKEGVVFEVYTCLKGKGSSEEHLHIRKKKTENVLVGQS